MSFILTNVVQSYNDRINIENFNKNRVREYHARLEKDRETAENLSKKLKKSHKSNCITGIMIAHCSRSHRFYKPVFCGKENCEFCGEDNSPAHIRRINAVIDTVKSWESLSYIVITVPEASRVYFQSKDMLNRFRRYVKRKLKRDGFKSGYIRWHWAGSCEACKGSKKLKASCFVCSGTGAGKVWKPHLNILLPAGNTVRVTPKGKVKQSVTCYVEGQQVLKKEYLDSWRADLKQWFKDELKIDSLANIYHTFIGKGTKDKEKRIRHKVRYITRATLRDPKLYEEVAHVIKGYKSFTKFGLWQKFTEKLPLNCPCCGEPLRWFAGDRESWYAGNKKKIEVQSGLYFIYDPVS